MKLTLLFTLVLLISTSVRATGNDTARRSNGLLRFIAEHRGIRDWGLLNIIGNRCNRYLHDNYEADQCRMAVKKMIELLDYDIIFSEDNYSGTLPRTAKESWAPSSFVFIAFKKNLMMLLSSPRTEEYLRDLNEQLYQYAVGIKAQPNVWEITKAHYKTDYSTALAMAALFQDTSRMKLHLAYLEKSNTPGNSSFQNNKELLGRVIDTINLILDSSEDHYRELFYPAEIQKDLNRNIYHFYVPLFLSKSLVKEGITEKYAFTAAMMLTLTYEFITSSNDYRYLVYDPERITSVHKIKDIFGGYCGSNIGVWGMDFFKNFEVIKYSFESSTEDSVNLLLHR